jgi:hypothetical protein
MDKAVTFVGTPYYLSPEILENKVLSFYLLNFFINYKKALLI